MTAALIELETLDLVSAANMLRRWAGEPVEQALRELWGTLSSCGGMAGSDPGGVAWASAYDRAAGAALNGGQAAAGGLDKLAAMFAQTARNYEAADAASAAGGRRVVEESIATLPCIAEFALPGGVPVSAGGAEGGGPPGWELIRPVVGCLWPNGHQDRLREAGAAWRRSAAALADGADATVSAVQRAISDRLPEAGDMWTVCNGMAARLRALADVHAGLGGACEELAGHLDQVHAEVISELVSLLEWTAAIEAGGALLGVLTLGIAEVPTQAIESARIAKTAATVASLIERFVALARGIAASVSSLAERAEAVAAQLGLVTRAPMLEASVVGVGGLRVMSSVGREVRAAARLSEHELPEVVVSAGQVEKKFKHAADFGVTGSRGREGFDAFRRALAEFVADPRTIRIWGSYRGERVVLSFNRRSRLVVVQKADGRFVTGWRMTASQLRHVSAKGALGGD